MSPRLTIMVAAVTLSAGRAGAQLAAPSPFLPAQNAAPAGAPTPGAPLEYRGTMETAEGVLYRIVDPAKKTGAWVKLNERESTLDFVVKRHEGSGDNDTIVVEQGGRSFTLPLRSAKVVSSGAAGNLAPPPPALMPAVANVPPAVTNAVVVNPTPADEQRRLEAVAAEVARRRALREQATQQLTPGGPVVQPVLPVAPPPQAPQRTPPTQQGRGQPPTRQR